MSGDKREQPLYWPEAMLQEIQEHAVRTDNSLSYIAQLAWKTAGAEIASLDGDALRGVVRGYAGSAKRKQTLFFPESMILEMQAHADRVDCSVSLLVQAAYVRAKPAIVALGAVGG